MTRQTEDKFVQVSYVGTQRFPNGDNYPFAGDQRMRLSELMNWLHERHIAEDTTTLITNIKDLT